MVIDIKQAREQPETLSPQIRNLIITIISSNTNFINNRPIEKESGKIIRRAANVTKQDLEHAAQLHGINPYRTHQLFNDSIRNIKDETRITRYTAASIGLEIILDRMAFPEHKEPIKGIPDYLMDGYTDMGCIEDNNERNGREKFRLNKDKIGNHLIWARKQVLEYKPEQRDQLLDITAQRIIKVMPYEGWEVELMVKMAGDRTITMDELDVGVCRHYAVMAQALLQEIGIKSKMEKGNHFGGRHAWNLLEGTTRTIFDITFKASHKNAKALYKEEIRSEFLYNTTPDDINFYKIVHK